MILNMYGPRLSERMKRKQEAGCVSIFSGILKDDNDKREEYVRFGRVETKRVEKDKGIRVGMPVETWMSGDCCSLQWLWGRKVPCLIGATIVTHRRHCGKWREV